MGVGRISMRALKWSLLFVMLAGAAAAEAPDAKEQNFAFLKSVLQNYHNIKPISCSVDQAKTCLDISNRCTASCKIAGESAYANCMSICSCNLYNCKTSCGDNSELPANCRPL